MNRIDELRRKISVDSDSESLLLRYEALVLREYAQFFSENLVPLKIVYEGPYCTGKSTTLAYLEALSNPINELKSIALEGDRQLFLTIPWDCETVCNVWPGLRLALSFATASGATYYKVTRRFLRKSVDGVVWTPSVDANWQSANRELFDECIADYGWEADRESSSVVIQFNSIELRRSLRKDQVIDNLGEFASTIPVIDVVLGSPSVPGDLTDSTEGVIETINDLLAQILSCPRRRVALLERTLEKSD